MPLTTVDKVKQAKDPKAAMLELAHALDRIEKLLGESPTDPAGGWSWGDEDEAEETPGDVEYTGEVVNGVKQGIMKEAKPPPDLLMTHDADGNEVMELPIPDEEEMERRRQFATDVLNLGIAWKELPGEAAIEAYAKGGALWLVNADRDLAMAYDPEVKKGLINEIESTHPREAQEVAKDIMKSEADKPTLGG